MCLYKKIVKWIGRQIIRDTKTVIVRTPGHAQRQKVVPRSMYIYMYMYVNKKLSPAKRQPPKGRKLILVEHANLCPSAKVCPKTDSCV